MSDEHSQRTTAAGQDSSADSRESGTGSNGDADTHTGADDTDTDGNSSGGLEPGGGPNRVVSDQSVDDILNSLDETKSAADSSETTTTTTTTGDSVTTEFDEDEIPAAEETASETDAAGSAATETGTRTGAESDAELESAAGSLPDETVDPDDEDASLEALAARVEDGTVTGADVRAAEAGDGRESTPDVDEIELSMDDLEATREQTGSSTEGADPSTTTELSDDAGPLAGSVQRGGETAAGDSSDDDRDGDGSPGLLGRLKGLFSR
ncbi:hypothetical protein GS429_17435 [Natronorubrum sp. JWXQ-INN-674]|uniref:Uncharacterized protein n=1 Tax=Natronorubrum halalkaliphilum TaxID=2691917 RepID=A0A6B0VSQ8_9EURY|nr:hypothetical protein [Natronorubrum halalkaliphilum]MXV63812.1 hypothetical protein [Natronorubrum halalkaliphilum]